MPICFGISFTKIHMNQARALVHVYMDGSVNISTGAVEMGQGVNTKMLQVAATVFSIHPNKIKINSTNTYRIANTSPSAASATADLNGMAVLEACSKILERIKNQAAVLLHTKVEKIAIINEMVFADGVATGFNWDKLVMESYLNRISLSEHGHYCMGILN